VIGLPPIFASSPGVTIDVISQYDDKGPAWYWNIIRMGEHTGTHFDAPVHWITGGDLPDNACDTIPARQFIGPACVIDVSAVVDRDPDFLLRAGRLDAWEAQHGRVPRGAWLLLRTGWSRRAEAASFLNVGPDGPHSPGFDAETSRVLALDSDCPRRRRRDHRYRRRPGRSVRSAVSEPQHHARRREVRPRQPVQSRPAPTALKVPLRFAGGPHRNRDDGRGCGFEPNDLLVKIGTGGAPHTTYVYCEKQSTLIILRGSTCPVTWYTAGE
jgi:hypothetical protein